MSGKMVTLGLLKINLSWNKDKDAIFFVYDVTNKILSSESNHIVDVIMWPKFGNSSLTRRKVITTSSLYGFDQKNHFFGEVVKLLNLSIIWDWH